jgi:hypothetical protein
MISFQFDSGLRLHFLKDVMKASEAKKVTNANRAYPGESEDFESCMKAIKQAASYGKSSVMFDLNGGANYYGGRNDFGETFSKKIEKLGYKVGCCAGPETCVATLYISW